MTAVSAASNRAPSAAITASTSTRGRICAQSPVKTWGGATGTAIRFGQYALEAATLIG